MVAPSIAARVKEPCEISRPGVQAGNVRSLELIATSAAEHEVIDRCPTSMLHGNYMIQHVRKFNDSVRDVAILAPI
jgi:hypothetical protein